MNWYLEVKYGKRPEKGGEEITVGGKKYLRYETLADLQKDFPGVR